MSSHLRFRPEALVCSPSSNRSTCLTTPQITAVRNLYSDYRNSNGSYIFAGWTPGGELGYSQIYVSGPEIFIGPEYFKNFVFS